MCDNEQLRLLYWADTNSAQTFPVSSFKMLQQGHLF